MNAVVNITKDERPKPFMVTRGALNFLFGSPTLARDLIKAGWIIVVRAGKPGRETLYDYSSAHIAYERLKAGEQPSVTTSTEATTETP